MPGGFSLTGGWDAPKPLEGMPDLKGESTDSLYRTLTGFREEAKTPGITPKWQHQYRQAIGNIQQELDYRGRLQSVITHFKRGMPHADPQTAKRMATAIGHLEDRLDKREGIERIEIPTSRNDQPSSGEIFHDGILGRYHRWDRRGTGAIMRGADGKYYAFKGRSVFDVIPDEINMRGEVPRYRMAYRSKSLDAKRAWPAGFAIAQKGRPGSGNWGHAGRRGMRGGSLPKSTAMSLSTGATAQARQQGAIKKEPAQDVAKLEKEAFSQMPAASQKMYEQAVQGGYITTPAQKIETLELAMAAHRIANRPDLGHIAEALQYTTGGGIKKVVDYQRGCLNAEEPWVRDSAKSILERLSDVQRERGRMKQGLAPIGEITRQFKGVTATTAPKFNAHIRKLVGDMDTKGYDILDGVGADKRTNAIVYRIGPELFMASMSTVGSSIQGELVPISEGQVQFYPEFRTKSLDRIIKGGPGSGNWGHAGRKGQRGGSLPKQTAMSLATGATAEERQQYAKDDARWDEAAAKRRAEVTQAVAKNEEDLKNLRERGYREGKPYEKGTYGQAAIPGIQNQMESWQGHLLDLSYTNRELRDVAKQRGTDLKIEILEDGQRVLKWTQDGRESMSGRPSTFFRATGGTPDWKLTKTEDRAMDRGAQGVREGNPAIMGIIGRPFYPVDRIRSATRGMFGNRNPREIGVNRYTGQTNYGEREGAAKQVYDLVLAELGARHADGQRPPSARVIQQIIMSEFGVPLSAIR